jgi:hypothetical protein
VSLYDYSDPGRSEPTEKETQEWCEREKARRKAWLEGPTAAEKHEWARRVARRRSYSGSSYAGAYPTDQEVEEWARREQQRRKSWLEGPSEEERRSWTRARRREADWANRLDSSASDAEDYLDDVGMDRFWREAELAVKGGMTLMRWPRWIWSEMVDAGRSWERNTPFGNRRVSLYDDD